MTENFTIFQKLPGKPWRPLMTMVSGSQASSVIKGLHSMAKSKGDQIEFIAVDHVTLPEVKETLEINVSMNQALRNVYRRRKR